jgi:hypothetical protein
MVDPDSDPENWYSDPRNFFNTLPDGLPKPEVYLTPDEAVSTVNAAKDELFAVYDRLKSVVEVHEFTIRKRWAKVSMLADSNATTSFTARRPNFPSENSSQAAISSSRSVP